MAKENFSLIVLCGMDGSGKTTLANRLATELASRGVETEVIHGHTYAASSNSFGFSEERIRKYRILLRLVLPLAWLDNLYTYFTRYRSAGRGKTIISDRYFYDKAARLLYFGIGGKELMKLYVKTLPRPQHIFFLDLPEDIAARRKEDYSREQLKNFRNAYRYLARVLNAPLIDSSEPPEKCVKSMLENILDHEKTAPKTEG